MAAFGCCLAGWKHDSESGLQCIHATFQCLESSIFWTSQRYGRHSVNVPHPTPDFLHFDFDHGLFVRFQSCGAVGSHGSTWISWVTWWRIWRLQRLVAKAGEDQAPRSLDWYCRVTTAWENPATPWRSLWKIWQPLWKKAKWRILSQKEISPVLDVNMQKWLNAVELSELAAENDKTCSCGIAVDWVVCVQWFATVTYVSGFGFEVGIEICKVFCILGLTLLNPFSNQSLKDLIQCDLEKCLLNRSFLFFRWWTFLDISCLWGVDGRFSAVSNLILGWLPRSQVSGLMHTGGYWGLKGKFWDLCFPSVWNFTFINHPGYAVCKCIDILYLIYAI